MARKSATAATGAPWKLPHDSTRPSGRTTGLSMNDTQLAIGDRRWRTRRCRGPRRGPAACSAASRRPARGRRRSGGWRRSPSRRATPAGSPRSSAARPVGASPRRSSAKARSVPRSASVDIAPAMSAVTSSTSRSASASTTMPSIPSVPLISARPSLARRTSGATPASRHAVTPSISVPSRAARRALTEQHEGRRGERCQVATGSERAVLGDDRRDAGVEQRHDGLDDGGAGPGVTHRQAAGAQQHHRPHHLALHLGAEPGGVRADQRQLQLL